MVKKSSFIAVLALLSLLLLSSTIVWGGSWSVDSSTEWYDNASENDVRITIPDGNIKLTGESAVGWWSMDNNTDNTVHDLTSYVNDGTMNGGMGLDNYVTGQWDTGLDFDGSDDYVDLGSDSSLDLDNESFTITMWLNILDDGAESGMLSKGKNGSSGESLHLTESQADTASLGLRFYEGLTNNYDLATSSGAFNFGEWFHATFRFDKSANNEQSIWVNGELLATNNADGTLVSTDTDRMVLGFVDESSDRYFNGTMDEVQVYVGVLSENEIQRIYNRTKPPEMTGSDLELGTWTSTIWDSGASREQQIDNLEVNCTIGANETADVRVNVDEDNDGTIETNGTWTSLSDGTNTLSPSDLGLDGVTGYRFQVEYNLSVTDSDTTHSPSVQNYTLNVSSVVRAWSEIETWSGTTETTAEWDSVDVWTGDIISSANWKEIEFWTGDVKTVANWIEIEKWTGTVQTVAEWVTVEAWSGAVQTAAEWFSIEAWSGAIKTVAEWSSVESWIGTISTKAVWQEITVWSGTVRTVANWKEVEVWSGIVRTPQWQVIETWTGNVVTVAVWKEIEKWQGTVSAPAWWTEVEVWSGDVVTSAEWITITTWSGGIEAPANWVEVELWAGDIETIANWQEIEKWSDTVTTVAQWREVSLWSGIVQTTANWQEIGSWAGDVVTIAEWKQIQIWTGTIRTQANWQTIDTWSRRIISAPINWQSVEVWSVTVEGAIMAEATTGNATNIGTGSATLNTFVAYGSYDNVNITFQYREASTDEWYTMRRTTDYSESTYSDDVAGLSSDTKYEFRAHINFGDSLSEEDFGSIKSFTTEEKMVKKPAEKLVYDAIIEAKPKEVKQGDDATVKSDIWRVSGSGTHDVIIKYTIVGPDGKAYFEKSQTQAISARVIEESVNTEGWPVQRYTVHGKIEWSRGTAESTAAFEVVEKPWWEKLIDWISQLLGL